jgi:hypothetical protein
MAYKRTRQIVGVETNGNSLTGIRSSPRLTTTVPCDARLSLRGCTPAGCLWRAGKPMGIATQRVTRCQEARAPWAIDRGIDFCGSR